MSISPAFLSSCDGKRKAAVVLRPRLSSSGSERHFPNLPPRASIVFFPCVPFLGLRDYFRKTIYDAIRRACPAGSALGLTTAEGRMQAMGCFKACMCSELTATMRIKWIARKHLGCPRRGVVLFCSCFRDMENVELEVTLKTCFGLSRSDFGLLNTQ